MKPNRINPFLRLAIVPAITLSAHAANYTWDTVPGDGATITAGSGTWDNVTANWNTSGANVPWSGNNTAVFAGADGTYAINLAGNFTTSAVLLNFTNGGYTLGATAAHSLTTTYSSSTSSANPATAATSLIWVEAGKTATIGSDVTINANGASFGVKIGLGSGSQLNIGSGATLAKAAGTNRDLCFGGIGTVNVAGTIARTVAGDSAGIVVGQWNTDNVVMNVNDGGVINTVSNGTANNNGSILAGCLTGSTGTLTINAGATVIASETTNALSGLKIARDSGSTGIVNLNGGSLTVRKVFRGSGAGTLNLNGGTLKPNSNNTTDFMTGLSRANVCDGGAIIDTNGFNATISQDLVHSDLPGDSATDGGLTKTGAGTLRLTGSSSFTGPTAVNGGTLNVDFTGKLTSPVNVNSGGTLTGSGIIENTATFAAGSALSVITDASYPLAFDGVSFTGTTTLTFSGPVANGSTYNLFTPGTGGVTGLGNLVSSFRVNLATDPSSGAVTGTVQTGTRTWNTDSGTWQVNGPLNWAEGDQKYFNGDSVVFNNRPSPSIVTVSGILTPAAVTVNNTTSAYTFSGSGSISGVSELVKNGSGVLNLDNANNYSGATSVNAGTVNLSGSLTGTAITVAPAGTFHQTGSGVISGNASLTVGGNALLAGVNTYTGVTTIDAGGTLKLGDGATDGTVVSPVVNNGALVFETGGTPTFAGHVTGTGSVNKLGFGTLTLSNATAGSHSGGTAVTEGTLVAHSNALNGGPVAIAEGATLSFIGTGVESTSTVSGGGMISNTTGEILYVGNHAGFTGSLTTSGNTQFNSAVSGSPNATYNVTGGLLIFGAGGDYPVKFGSFASSGGTIRGANAATATGTTTLEIGHLGTDSTISGTFTDGGTKKLALTKVGSGRLTLAGGKGYTGITTVNAGTLQVDNGLASAIVFVNGGALAGNGTLAGPLTVGAAGTVSPGVATGTLTAGTTAIDGTYACEIDGAASDRLAVNGNLDIDGATLNVSVLGGGTTQAEYIIATYTGTLTGTFTVGSPLPAGYTVSYATSGQVKLVGTPTSGYASWASTLGLTEGVNDGTGQDAEQDGFDNGTEYILGGSPMSGSNNPKIYSLVADSSDEGTEKELILTIAVPQGTPAFSTGPGASTATFQGFGITVRGGGNLTNFDRAVIPVAPVTTGLPGAPVQGGISYEYRSFSLGGSNGVAGKGFLQVMVTHPAP